MSAPAASGGITPMQILLFVLVGYIGLELLSQGIQIAMGRISTIPTSSFVRIGIAILSITGAIALSKIWMMIKPAAAPAPHP